MIPSFHLKLNHGLKKEAGSTGYEAAGSWPRVQLAEPQPALILPEVPPCMAASRWARVYRPQNIYVSENPPGSPVTSYHCPQVLNVKTEEIGPIYYQLRKKD